VCACLCVCVCVCVCLCVFPARARVWGGGGLFGGWWLGERGAPAHPNACLPAQTEGFLYRSMRNLSRAANALASEGVRETGLVWWSYEVQKVLVVQNPRNPSPSFAEARRTPRKRKGLAGMKDHSR
jgi:hypothetical protein